MRINRALALVAACLTVGSMTTTPAQASPQSAQSTHHPELIAFAATVGGEDALFTIGADGSDLRQITHEAAVHYRNPDWSPDGRLLVFDADDGVSTSWLVVAHADGSHATKVSSPGVQVGQPSFSPDGRRLYFERFDGVEDPIYRSDLTGGHLKRVTNPPLGYGDTDPNVSPDGKTLSFVRLSDGSDDGPAALFVKDLATGTEKQLTSYATNVAVKQDWSADSRHIGFTRDGYDRPPGANSNVVVIDRSGKHRHDITHFTDRGTQAFFGSYSPDGRWIVIRREDGVLHSLVKIRPDGSHPVTIMSIPGFSPHFIAWGPASE